jgi:hypothetical protein
MREKLLEEIRHEVHRVVGPAGMEVELHADPACGAIVRIETYEAVWAMQPEDLLHLLRAMPDRAGVLAVREEADRHPGRLACV